MAKEKKDALDLLDDFEICMGMARGIIGCAVTALLNENASHQDVLHALEGADKLLSRASKKAHALYEITRQQEAQP